MKYERLASREIEFEGHSVAFNLEKVGKEYWLGIDLFWFEADGDTDEAGLFCGKFASLATAKHAYASPDEAMLRRRIAETLSVKPYPTPKGN